MRNRLVIPWFLGILCLAGWPSVIWAYAIEQRPYASVAASFLLVADIRMRDPRFRQSVILVTRHGATGPIGVIINRPQNVTLDMLFPGYPAARVMKLFTGGPVYPNQISFLVRGAEAVPGVLVISPSFYLAYGNELLLELLSGKRRYSGLRVVHGMASWAPGQLENEIGRGDWVALPVDEKLIFDQPAEGMWLELYRRARRSE